MDTVAQEIEIAAAQVDAGLVDLVAQCGPDSWASDLVEKAGAGQVRALDLLINGKRAGVAVLEAVRPVLKIHAMVSMMRGRHVARTFLPVSYAIAQACGCDRVACFTERAGLAWVLKNNGFSSVRRSDGWDLERAI